MADLCTNAGAVEIQHPLGLVHRHPVRAGLAQPPVEQPIQAIFLEPGALAPERPFRDAQPFRGFRRAQPASLETLVHLCEPHQADLLEHPCPVHRHPPSLEAF